MYTILQRGMSAPVSWEKGLRPIATGVHGNNLAQPSGGDFVFQHCIFRFEPKHLADHQNSMGGGATSDHTLAVFQVERKRLLHENMLPVFKRPHHGIKMRMLRGDYVYGIQFRNRAKFGGRVTDGRDVEFPRHLFRPLAIKVINRGDFSCAHRPKCLKMTFPKRPLPIRPIRTFSILLAPP